MYSIKSTYLVFNTSSIVTKIKVVIKLKRVLVNM